MMTDIAYHPLIKHLLHGCLCTGAGKSTLSLALLRFVEPTAGSILIDGLDICKMGLQDLRHRVTIIPQDPLLFKGTLRSNLDPFEENDDTTLWESLRRAHLVDQACPSTSPPSESSETNAEESAPEGATNSVVFKSLETAISENGGNISLGQRQLVALARALVRRSKVVSICSSSLLWTHCQNQFWLRHAGHHYG